MRLSLRIDRLTDNRLVSPLRQSAVIKLAAHLVLCLCVFGLAGCKSPEQKLKERQEFLQTFVTGVVKHLLDRNPDTIRESITHLHREELPEPVWEKLQAQGLLPQTELGVLKIINEAQDNHTTNEINVQEVKPLGPVDKDVVPFQVTGVQTDKQTGKPDQQKPFSCTVSCKLNDQTGGWPQVVEITGLAPQAKPQPKQDVKPKGKKKRRR